MPAGAGAYENEFPLICFLVSSAPRSSARDSMRIRPDFGQISPYGIETITSRRPTNGSSRARNRTSPGPRSDPGIALFKSARIDQQSKKRIPVIQFFLDTHNGLILNRNRRGVPEQGCSAHFLKLHEQGSLATWESGLAGSADFQRPPTQMRP